MSSAVLLVEGLAALQWLVLLCVLHQIYHILTPTLQTHGHSKINNGLHHQGLLQGLLDLETFLGPIMDHPQLKKLSQNTLEINEIVDLDAWGDAYTTRKNATLRRRMRGRSLRLRKIQRSPR